MSSSRPWRPQRAGKVPVASSASGREGTIATDQLRHFLDGLDVPVLAMLRDTQLYVQMRRAARPVGHHAHPCRRDLAQWQPLVEWALQ
jgi:chromosome partitioning protein